MAGMNPPLFLFVLLGVASSLSHAAQVKIGVHNFTVPEGFTIDRVAGPGLIDRPIVADFDEQGRLYVAESSGANDPVDKQLKEKPHRIIRLEDTNADGIFDKSIVYADKMMFPEGAMWLAGSLYVSAPPVIWKLTDTDGDGVADKREEWLDAKTLTGCANDLHGPYLGLDGWIYWCKGAFAKQTYDQKDKPPFQTRAAHIFRRRPQGGIVEAVMTGGMDNPVDVTFTPEGERIFTTTFFQHPGGGQRDGLVHAIYGGVYGKVHDVIDDHKKTGELMPVLTQLGPAAPAGLTRYEAATFGEEYRDNLFACLFNLHKVTRHVLQPAGASFRSVDSDFVVSDNTDFHPTDVIEDADGSLLIVDTGGWYKLCCPTSQLWKPDVLGAIYRIRRTGATTVADPRGSKISWANLNAGALAALLGDSRPAVVRRAVHQLRTSDGSAAPLEKVLRGEGSERQKVNAVWALASNGDPNSSRALNTALGSSHAAVKHAALHALAVTPEKANLKEIASLLLESGPAQVRRAAAELIGRTRSSTAVPLLLQAAERLKPAEGKILPDRVQEHSIIYALIEINSPKETRAGAGSKNSFARRGALIALDQMGSGTLQAGEVVPLLSSTDPVLKETAHWIVAHRNEWGAELSAYFTAQLKDEHLNAAARAELEKQVRTLSRSAPIQDLVSSVAADPNLSTTVRGSAFRIMQGAGLKETPASWVMAVSKTLKSTGVDLAAEAVAAAGAMSFKQPPAELKAELTLLARKPSTPARVRLEALAAVAGGLELDSDLFRFVQGQLAPQAPDRRLAAGIMARAALNEAQLRALLENLKTAAPLEFAQLLTAYEKGGSEEMGSALIEALGEKNSSHANVDQLKRVFAKFPDSVKNHANELIASANVDAAQQSARIEELLPKLKDGDIRRGQAIFNSQNTACSTCHAIGYLGGDIGPDLTRIGQVRTERDLLEAILFPSASFVRSYEPVVVTTKDGEEFSGVLKKDAADEVILSTGPGAQVRLARAEITETRPGKLSVMPQGLEEQLTQQQLADLVAFLRATRW